MSMPDPMALSDGQYEFDYNEPEIIRRCGARARLWGIISVLIGVVLTVVSVGMFAYGGVITAALARGPFKDMMLLVGGATLLAAIALLALAAVHLVSGWFYVRSGEYLQAVVDTQGDDVELLMNSLQRMGSAFMIEFTLMLISVGLRGRAKTT